MNKKIAILAAAMLLVVSVAGCGAKKNGTTSQNTTTDASGAYSVDMAKVDGEKLSSSSDKEEYKGEIGDAEITIGDAKVISYEDGDIVIVSFEYKNNSSTDTPFTGAVKADAYQGDSHLAPTVVSDVEGIDMLSLSENVAKGDTVTVQKAFVLDNNSTEITVEVTPALDDQVASNGLTKTFSF